MRKFFGGFFRNSAKKMVKPIQKAPSMPINAGKRLSGGMTSASKMPTQLSATRSGARKVAKQPKVQVARPNVQAFRGSKFIPGKGVAKKNYGTPKPTTRLGFMNKSNYSFSVTQ